MIETGESAPTGVAAEFDEAGANHNAKPEPAKKPENEKRRRTFWKWSGVEQRAEKDRKESGLEQLNFPAVAVPNLTNVDDRHVHRPKNGEQDCVRVTSESNQRKNEPNPRNNGKSLIGYS